jgi:protein-disulfide isomerase
MRTIAALLVGLGLCLAGCNSATKGPSAATPDDMSLGNPNAKVTVVEYASVGCPICAAWNNQTFPAFKAKYVDTGKVHYVLKEMLTGDAPVAAAGFLLARCAGKDKYFTIVDEVWRQEAPYLEHEDAGPQKRDILVKIAQSAGMTQDQFTACVDNEAALKALNAKAQRYEEKDKVTGTPTFVINGKTLPSNFPSLADMDQAIAQAQAPAK